MARFSSTPVAVAYFLLAGMGVVALLTVAGALPDALVQQRLVPGLFATLALLAGWEYWRRRG